MSLNSILLFNIPFVQYVNVLQQSGISTHADTCVVSSNRFNAEHANVRKNPCVIIQSTKNYIIFDNLNVILFFRYFVTRQRRQ